MNRWKIGEAKARLSAVLQASREEPQLICNRDEPVGALVSIEEYDRLMALNKEAARPTVSRLLSELREIQAEEPGEIAVPERRDRANSLLESTNELSD